VVIAMVVSGVSYAIVSRPSARARQTGTSSSSTTLAQSGPFVSPKAPYALAVAPNGDLLVVDSGRDQILRHLPSGKFQVIAGDGERGFSGDGGQAIRARINVQGDSGIAVVKNGTVYFADSGNGRVREVLPNGIIKTVAGGGKRALPNRVGEHVPAREASLGAVAGIAIAPSSNVAIAAQYIVALTLGGNLVWVAGSDEWQPWCAKCSIGEYNFWNVDQLAFDGAGDLVATSSDFPEAAFGIAEIRADGLLVDLGGLRGEGGEPGAIAPGPDGSVIAAAQLSLYSIAKGGESLALIPGTRDSGSQPWSSSLSKALGPWPRRPNPAHLQETFWGGDGVAASSGGEIYADTSPFIGVSGYAIVEQGPSGAAKAVFESWKPAH
jgi:hypothetical protein